MNERPVLVMLPGTLCDARLFQRQRRALRMEASVLTPDFSALKDRSDWLDDLLKGLPPRFFLAGFSLGGLLAFEIVRRARQRVQGLALIASNAQPASARGRRRSAAMKRLWLSRGPELVIDRVQGNYFHHRVNARRHAALIVDMARATPRDSAFEQFAWAAQRPGSLATLSEFSGPVLSISGACDRLCPPAWQRAMQQAQPRMNWIEIARCGHFLPLEASAQLSDALVQWLHSPPSSDCSDHPAASPPIDT